MTRKPGIAAHTAVLGPLLANVIRSGVLVGRTAGFQYDEETRHKATTAFTESLESLVQEIDRLQ